MKKPLTFVVIMGIVLAGVALVTLFMSRENLMASDNQMSSNESSLYQNTILISNFNFTPESMSVKKGTTVTWRNRDTAKHDVNFVDDSIADGPLLEQDAEYSFTFNDVGTFDYACTPHPFMKATITVTE